MRRVRHEQTLQIVFVRCLAGALVLSPPGASGGACTPSRFAPQPSPAMANTTWPTEHADGWRTHAVAAGLPSDVGHMRLHTRVATLPPVPVLAVGFTPAQPATMSPKMTVETLKQRGSFMLRTIALLNSRCADKYSTRNKSGG